MSNIRFALLGSLPKGDNTRENWHDWKQEYMSQISALVPSAVFIHGDLISDNVGPELVVGHDLWLVKNSDIIVVNAESKIGAGTAQEMVMAKVFEKPVFTVLPKDSHHRRSNITMGGAQIEDWIHPFIYASSDCISENVQEAAQQISKYCADKSSINIKTIRDICDLTGKFEVTFPQLIEEYNKTDSEK